MGAAVIPFRPQRPPAKRVPAKEPDHLNVRDLVTSAVRAFAEEYGLVGEHDRRWLLRQISRNALEMGREIR